MLSEELIQDIDESPWFRAAGAPYLVVDTDLRIRAVNAAYEAAVEHPRSVLVGERMFDVFPDNPSDPGADGVAKLSASFESVFSRGKRHWMGVQQYDVRDLSRRGHFRYKVWTPVNSPLDQDGRTVGVLHHVCDVTAVISPLHDGVPWRDITTVARELHGSFPGLTWEAVLGVLTHSHRVVMDATGAPNPRRAEELATLRLELLAGHPRVGPA